MDIIEIKIIKLKNLLSNFKKAPNRQYRKVTLQNRLKQVNSLRTEIHNELIALEDSIDLQQFNTISLEEKQLTGELLTILKSKLECLKDKPEYTLKNLAKLAVISYRLSKTKTMPTTLIDVIKTVTALLPTYDGTPSKLGNFVDALNVVKQVTTDAAHLPTVINIVMTKLESKARYAFPATPASIDAVIEKLKEVSTPTPPESIIAKLANCKQKANITGYTKEVEELTMLLEAAYIAKQIPVQVAKTMATKEGIKHMAMGLKDEKTSIILKAGQYSNITDAINKVLEESPQNTNEVSVNFVRSYNQQRKPPSRFQTSMQTSRGQNNSNYRGHNRGQYNSNNNNNRYYQDRRDSGYNRDNRDRNDNGNNRQRFDYNQSRGRNNNQRNVYVAENGRGPSENPRSKAQQNNGEVTYPNKE